MVATPAALSTPRSPNGKPCAGTSCAASSSPAPHSPSSSPSATTPSPTHSPSSSSNPSSSSSLARRFLSEHPDRRLWIAALVGLIGVLIILRPGGGNHYSWTIGFSFVAAFFFAGYIVLARFASFSTTVAVISWTTALFGLIPILPLLPLDWRTPETTDTWLLMIAIGVLSGLGHTFIIIACRYLAAARVAILHYAEVGVAAILNWFVFRHFPDFWVWVGFIVIALTNLYALRLDHRPHHQ